MNTFYGHNVYTHKKRQNVQMSSLKCGLKVGETNIKNKFLVNALCKQKNNYF